LEKCVVLGASGFIGYELVCKLMEKYCVTAIITSDTNDCNETREEKIFAVGRNANVKFIDSDDFQHTNEEYKIMFNCHLIDKNQTRKDEKNDVINYLDNFNFEHIKELIWLIDKQKINNNIEKIIHEFMVDIGKKGTIIQIPDVYGPWQPMRHSIHQMIVHDIEQRGNPYVFNLPINELLYVEDVASAIISIGEMENKVEEYELTSVSSISLKKGTITNGIQDFITKLNIATERTQDDTVPYIIQSPFPLNEGLAKQKQHIQQFFHLY